MKKLFIILSTILLFVGCKQFEPELCRVYVEYCDHCIYKLDKEYVPKYTLVKLQVFPDQGYEFDCIRTGYDAKWFESKDEENTFYILVNRSSFSIDIYTNVKKSNFIFIDNVKNCSIDIDEEDTDPISSYYDYNRKYVGDTVTFTITPDRYYYISLSSVKVTNGNGTRNINFIQSQTNPNKFSFVMPDDNVTISTDLKFGINASSQNESYAIGDKIIFDIENHISDETFDLKISDNYKNITDYINVANNIKLSESYELPKNVLNNNDTGCFLLHIFPNGKSSPSVKVPFIVNLDTAPEGWTTVGIKEFHKYEGDFLYVQLFLSPYKDIDYYETINFNYSFQNKDSTKKIENSMNQYYHDELSFYANWFLDNNDLSPFDTFTVWVEDENLKYISKKITINLNNQNNEI